MEVLHAIKEEESRQVCPYCFTKQSNEGWRSSFSFEKHYKVKTCKCGNEVRVKVDFFGSGHDSWSPNDLKKKSKRIRSLEGKIKDVPTASIRTMN